MHKDERANWQARRCLAETSKSTSNCESDLCPADPRRSSANLEVVSERRQVESLRREEKTQRDALASTEDKIQQTDRQIASLDEEIQQVSSRQTEVRP